MLKYFVAMTALGSMPSSDVDYFGIEGLAKFFKDKAYLDMIKTKITKREYMRGSRNPTSLLR